MANGVYNALEGRRTMAPVPSKSRRRCSCGCGKRATHMMLADGCCMGTGCELLVRRWIRNPIDAWLTRRVRETATVLRPLLAAMEERK